jgi:hypothetical protein
MLYQLLADAVLVLHFAVALFVVGGFALILTGNRLDLTLVNRLWFRILHLTSITVVIAESWLNFTCPLTTFENLLRMAAGSPVYSGSFIEYWLHKFIFYDAPSWVFTVIYTVFGLLVLVTWWIFPPKSGKLYKKTSH